MTELTARTIAIVSIWLGVTIILTFGVFDFVYGDLTFLAHLSFTSIICYAAAFATAKVWGYDWPNWFSYACCEKRKFFDSKSSRISSKPISKSLSSFVEIPQQKGPRRAAKFTKTLIMELTALPS